MALRNIKDIKEKNQLKLVEKLIENNSLYIDSEGFLRDVKKSSSSVNIEQAPIIKKDMSLEKAKRKKKKEEEDLIRKNQYSKILQVKI